MGGIIIVFVNYNPRRGILGSDWVGFRCFLEFFKDIYFFRLMRNTFVLNVYDLNL
jgi:putative aldouronate transport system permease protein